MNTFDKFKKEIAVQMDALEMEMKKENPMPHYLLSKISEIERQLRIFKNNID